MCKNVALEAGPLAGLQKLVTLKWCPLKLLLKFNNYLSAKAKISPSKHPTGKSDLLFVVGTSCVLGGV